MPKPSYLSDNRCSIWIQLPPSHLLDLPILAHDLFHSSCTVAADDTLTVTQYTLAGTSLQGDLCIVQCAKGGYLPLQGIEQLMWWLINNTGTAWCVTLQHQVG